MDNPYNPNVLYGTIALGAGTTGPIDLRGYTLAAVVVPGTVLGTLLTFLASTDVNGTYFTVFDTAGNTLSAVYGTAGARVITDIPELAPVRYLKMVTSGTQSAEKAFGLLVK